MTSTYMTGIPESECESRLNLCVFQIQTIAFRVLHSSRTDVMNDFRLYDARELFPCYDDPRIRVPITLTIDHLSTVRAISNMPVHTRYDILIYDYSLNTIVIVDTCGHIERKRLMQTL